MDYGLFGGLKPEPELVAVTNGVEVGNRVSHRTNHLLGGSHVDGLPARRRNPRRGIRLHNVPSSGRRNGIIPW